jgi:hypothetical protein
MIPHRLLAALTALLLCSVAVASWRLEQPERQAATAATAPVGLPEAWFGKWEGPTQTIRPGGEVAGEFAMGLEIGPAPAQPAGGLPVYNWAISYTQGQNTQARPYLLRIATDEAGKALPGHFILDERNGILVDQFLLGSTMQGHFIVISRERRQILHARYELTTHEGKPAIEVEIATYDGNETRRSAVAEGGVESRRLLRVQRGILLKQA